MQNLTKLHAALKVAYFGPPNTAGMISAPAASDPSAALGGAKPQPYNAPAPTPAKAPDTKAINLPGEQIVSPDVLSGKLPVQMLGGDPANPSVMANVPVPGVSTAQPTTKPAPDWDALFARAHGTGFEATSKVDRQKMEIMKQMAAQGVDTSNLGAFARKLYANKGYRQKFPQYA